MWPLIYIARQLCDIVVVYFIVESALC